VASSRIQRRRPGNHRAGHCRQREGASWRTAFRRRVRVVAGSPLARYIWDTEENSGILIYVELADRRVEILADRGIAARVPQAEWDAICREMEEAFRAGQWRQGALAAVAHAGALLAEHFPAGERNPNELPDRPLML
jgi:uncharacterized membrane protein